MSDKDHTCRLVSPQIEPLTHSPRAIGLWKPSLYTPPPANNLCSMGDRSASVGAVQYRVKCDPPDFKVAYPLSRVQWGSAELQGKHQTITTTSKVTLSLVRQRSEITRHDADCLSLLHWKASCHGGRPNMQVVVCSGFVLLCTEKSRVDEKRLTDRVQRHARQRHPLHEGDYIMSQPTQWDRSPSLTLDARRNWSSGTLRFPCINGANQAACVADSSRSGDLRTVCSTRHGIQRSSLRPWRSRIQSS